jgi:hypothetical protein
LLEHIVHVRQIRIKEARVAFEADDVVRCQILETLLQPPENVSVLLYE